MSKATIALINLGGEIKIEGLRLADGTFAVSVSQVATLFSVLQNHSSRDIKALLGEGFQFPKVASELNPKPVNIISLSQFEIVMMMLDRKGNLKAQELRDSLAGLALNELFCDAFGVVSDARTRQAWLDARHDGLKERTIFTDAIKDWLDCNEIKSTYNIYADASDRVNLGLTGHRAKHWTERSGCKKGISLRDLWESSHLNKIKSVEEYASKLIRRGQDPRDAVEAAIGFYEFPLNSSPIK